MNTMWIRISPFSIAVASLNYFKWINLLFVGSAGWHRPCLTKTAPVQYGEALWWEKEAKEARDTSVRVEYISW